MLATIFRVLFAILFAASLVWLSPQPVRWWNAWFDPDIDQEMRTRSVLVVAGSDMQAWVRRHGRVPREDEGLVVLETAQFPIRDGWGRPIAYHPRPVGSTPPFELYSLGRDGVDRHGRGANMDYWSVRR